MVETERGLFPEFAQRVAGTGKQPIRRVAGNAARPGYHQPSGSSQEWCTPPKYVAAVREFFGGAVSLDPCSNNYSTVNADVEWRLPSVDGLRMEWDYPTVFVNPPYGRDPNRGTTIYDWLRRCADARYSHGSEVLALVPVATNTRHWKHFVFGKASAVAFLHDTRLRFCIDGYPSDKGSPRPCAMVYWGANITCFGEVFARYGEVVHLRRGGVQPPGK